VRLSWMVYAHSKFVPAGARLPFVIYLHHVAQACEPQDSQGKHTSHLARIPLVPTQVQENVKDISLVQAERMHGTALTALVVSYARMSLV
jgi:hypothetical protein